MAYFSRDFDFTKLMNPATICENQKCEKYLDYGCSPYYRDLAKNSYVKANFDVIHEI